MSKRDWPATLLRQRRCTTTLTIPPQNRGVCVAPTECKGFLPGRPFGNTDATLVREQRLWRREGTKLVDKENTQITKRPWLASMAGVVLLFAGAGALLGQDQPTVTNSQTLTRAEEIDQAREAKSRQLQREVPTPGEQRFVRIVRDLDALFGGHDGVPCSLPRSSWQRTASSRSTK